MCISPNGFVFPRNNGNTIFREKSGNLILPDRIRLTTTHVIAMFSNTPTLFLSHNKKLYKFLKELIEKKSSQFSSLKCKYNKKNINN